MSVTGNLNKNKINIIFCFVLHVGKTFYYRGCGWRPKKMGWTREDKAWIKSMIKLFDDLFGPDFCQYEDTETKHRILVPGQLSVRMYDHNEWERNAGRVTVKDDGEDDSASKESVNAATVKKVNVEEDDQEADYRWAQQTEIEIVNAEEAQEQHDGLKQTENAETVTIEEAQEEDDSIAKQTENTDIVGEQDARPPKQNQRNKNADLARFSDLKNLTRAELAALKLPDVAFITEKEVTVGSTSNYRCRHWGPILATQGPGEAILQHACKLL